MSISSEITALNTNLQNAKSAVTAKGGTVGDTGLAGLASEIATIPSGGGADTLPVEMEGMTGTGHVTAYDPQTGIITGDGFGTQSGTVWLLDRDTHTYKAQPTSSWSDTSITLTSPIDTSVIEGYTSLGVEDANHVWTTKIIIDGDIEPEASVIVYFRNQSTGEIEKATTTAISMSGVSLGSSYPNEKVVFGGKTFYSSDIVGIMISKELVNVPSSFLDQLVNLNQPIRLWPLVFTSSNCLRNAISFNQPVEFVGTYNRATGTSFMYGCSSFNQPIAFPECVSSIGQNSLYGCRSFNQSVVVPTTIASVANGFLYSTACPYVEFHNTGSFSSANFMGYLLGPCTINVETSVTPPTAANTTLSASSMNAAGYIGGITIKGPYRQAWLDRYQTTTSSPYRHIIDGGE